MMFLKRNSKKKSNISGCKSGATQEEDTQKESFGDKSWCWCHVISAAESLCYAPPPPRLLLHNHLNAAEISTLLSTSLSGESPSALFKCERATSAESPDPVLWMSSGGHVWKWLQSDDTVLPAQSCWKVFSEEPAAGTELQLALCTNMEMKSRKTLMSWIPTCKPQTLNLKIYLDAAPATVCKQNMQFPLAAQCVAGVANPLGELETGLGSDGLRWWRLVCSQQEGSGRFWACLQTDVGLFQGGG